MGVIRGMSMAEYRLTLARIVRVGRLTTHVALNAWAHGQITAPVDTFALMEISVAGSALP